MDLGRDSVCPKCCGTMIGDGYTVVLHCEFADVPEGVEPDAPPVYCDFTEGGK
jgi:hypothetical protein